MTPAPDLVERLAAQDVIVCCGSGGVGKTTVSAALGMGIASTLDRRVLVLTIDPARRLASALGMEAIGTRPVEVPARRLRAAGLAPRGELHAAMLDMRTEWDRLVERHARSAEVRDRILANPFYTGLSGAFVSSQAYVALEALYDLHASGEYGCIVVDTPPSRDALDFLEAPNRITDFVAARLLRWLTRPSRFGWRAVNLAATPFLRMADRLLGGEVLEDLAAFARDIQELYEGVHRRAAAVYDLLRAPSTAFAVVTTLDARPFAEAEFFCRKLREYGMPLRAFVVNRVLPDGLRSPAAVRAATMMVEDSSVADWLASELDEPVPEAMPRRLGRSFLALHALAESDARQVDRLGSLGRVPVARLPFASREVSDLVTLAQLATGLRGCRDLPDEG